MILNLINVIGIGVVTWNNCMGVSICSGAGADKCKTGFLQNTLGLILHGTDGWGHRRVAVVNV